MRWYAVKTKFKCEKYVVADLSRRGIEAYAPLMSITKRYKRKVKTYQVPIISCYVFVRIDLTHHVDVLKSAYVIEFVHFGGKVHPIPNEEIDVLRRVVGEQEVSVEPSTWEVGDEVEVVSGYLTGIRGFLLGKKGKNSFVVRLNSLGFDLRMDVDEKVLRRRTISQLAGVT